MILSHKMLYFHRKNEIPFVNSKINVSNFKLCREEAKESKNTSQNRATLLELRETRCSYSFYVVLFFFFIHVIWFRLFQLRQFSKAHPMSYSGERYDPGH